MIRLTNWLRLSTILALISLLLAYLATIVHPSSFKIIPLFGLGYPIILIFNLLFLVIWGLKKSKWFLIILCFLLLGGSLHIRSFATNFSKLKTNEEPFLKVLSYNVRLFDAYNEDLSERNSNRDGIIQYVQKVDPDVICFQEFYYQTKPTYFNTRDTLMELFNVKYLNERYTKNLSYGQYFGICLISKYEILSMGDVMFPNFRNTDNYCIFADILKNNDTIRIYNVHLQSIKLEREDYTFYGEKSNPNNIKSTARLLLEKLTVAFPNRAEQAVSVMEHVKTSPYPVIICGDFNDTPMSFVYSQFNESLIDSYRETSWGIGQTYVGRVPAGRIDYLFHSKELKARNFKIQNKTHSDHRAISCEFDLNK